MYWIENDENNNLLNSFWCPCRGEICLFKSCTCYGGACKYHCEWKHVCYSQLTP